MATERPGDPAQRDVAWVGYSPRAMAPVVAVVAVASLVVWTGRYFLTDIARLADRVGALAVFALAWGVWLGVGFVFLYRTVTHTYRLTDRALLVDFGFLSRPVPPIPLAEIGAVTVGGGWVGRSLGVGCVGVRAGDREVRLNGVRRPGLFAETLRAAAAAARGGK